MPQLPLIYRNKYREQIPMNAKLIELNRQKKLKGDAAYIFMETKPREELYDLKNDPYEVHNLANDMNYRERLTEYRNALSNWQLEIGDKGFIPEHDLVEMFWPEMLQPKTENVLISSAKKNTIVLSCKTEGASIGYQTGKAIGTKSWQLYYKPIKIKGKEKLVARAIRIGYKASEITSN